MKPLEQRIAGTKPKDVFRQIYLHGTVSRQQLNEEGPLTASTLTRTLDELAEGGWIREVGFGESSGGRRPILYEVQPRSGLLLGLDISRTGARLVLCDMQLRPLHTRTWPMDRELTPERLIGRVEACVNEWIGKTCSRDELLGLGVGAVGPLQAAEGIILDPLHFPAPGWGNVPIARLLEERLELPVLMDNGANAAIWGEYLTSEQKYAHLLYVNAGIGLRSASISNGQVIYGAADMEGSVGQMIIQTDGWPPRDPGGNYGSWESYASIYALERRAAAAVRMGRETSLAGRSEQGEVSFGILLEEAAKDDPVARELLQECATYFGIGLANLINILHPEKVVLGGPLVTGHPSFFRIATQVATRKTYHYPQYVPIFGTSKREDEAIAVGAAALLLRKLWS
ncbi:ROK family protein [Cohnella zeiphila]|uniref:ROK family protein n=1 Tax=Cohnella zeiphila TaxID=2761120 RepID=A0A7X0VUG8_9BACL|nr:ROK family protein [Cohnella zeiphila]MBB6730941.1 ROK family protein [Cohnella zeiphila]